MTRKNIKKTAPMTKKIYSKIISRIKKIKPNFKIKKKRKQESIKTYDLLGYDKDYSLCKDYKLYGICSYGLTCKFVHLRDFK